MNDFYEEYIKLSEKLCTTKDYGSRNKIRQHNITLKSIIRLQNTIMKEYDSKSLTAFCGKLLESENEMVIINIAAFCLENRILMQESINCLESIINTSKDKTIVFDAVMLLNKYKRESD